MPEINLGIGRGQGILEGWQREWLYWFDQQGNRYLSPAEVAKQECAAREAIKQAQELAAILACYRQQFGELPDP